MKGVTLYQQLLKETEKHPRRHKLSVNLYDQPEPSSRLKTGKWYAHVHQAKIYNSNVGSRWLGTGRLVQKLRDTFREAYYPRIEKPKDRTPRNNGYIGHCSLFF
eukprot:TRINITY_DN4020_c0_g1_i1.p1 TRINITY_DN4020_c0_g1~~TRINITY_DN4020_c0_g1_i1.p1  ORF type:complete len:104 (+),score=7.55 TRINITY_DN4020_c0_g1_i1:211-522(+)